MSTAYLDIDANGIVSFPVKASTRIFKNNFVGDDGAGAARGLVAGDPFLGVSTMDADNSTGLVAAMSVQVSRLPQVVKAAISGLAVTDLHKPVYASDATTATLTSTSNSRIGIVEKYLSSGVGLVRLDLQPTASDLGTVANATAYKVGGVAGADFTGAVTNITVVKGIVTAAS